MEGICIRCLSRQFYLAHCNMCKSKIRKLECGECGPNKSLSFSQGFQLFSRQLDWTGILKFVFMLRGMQLKSNHFQVRLTSVALIVCVRIEELVVQDRLPLDC